MLFLKMLQPERFQDSPLLCSPQFGSIIAVLRHVPNRPLDLQCARVLMSYSEKLSNR
jgi:hypothetical protein